MRCTSIQIRLRANFAANSGKALGIICLALLLLFLPQTSSGQKQETAPRPFLLSVLSNSHTEINPNYQYVASSEAHGAWLHLARTIPMGIDRSSLSLQSRISLLHGAIGIRTSDDVQQELRWSAGLLKGDIYRAPLAVGITLLDYDRLGQYDLEARWIDLRLGPAVRWEAGWGAVEPRVVGSVGASSLRPGIDNFSAIGSQAGRTVHGFDTSYRVELPIRVNYWFLVSVSAGQRLLLGERNLYITRGQIEAQTVLLPKLQLYTRYRIENLKTRSQSEDIRSVRLGIRVWL